MMICACAAVLISINRFILVVSSRFILPGLFVAFVNTPQSYTLVPEVGHGASRQQKRQQLEK